MSEGKLFTLLDSLKKQGFHAIHQIVSDEDDYVIGDEIVIYDERNGNQLFYITPDELGQTFDIPKHFNTNLFIDEVKRAYPDILS